MKPAPPRSRFLVTILTARAGERPYAVDAHDEHAAISAACRRVAEDDAAWHVLDVVGVRRLGV